MSSVPSSSSSNNPTPSAQLSHSSTGTNPKGTKLPNQLASIIQDEGRNLQAQGLLNVPGSATVASANEVVAAAHSRSVKELSSYVRAVCMRLGFNE